MKIEITNRMACIVLAIGITLALSGGVALVVQAQTQNPLPQQPRPIQVLPSSSLGRPQPISAACAANASGVLRVATASSPCTAGETPIMWNQAGPPGPPGPAGPPGMSGLEIVTHKSAFSTTPSVFVECPSGKRVIAAGYDTEWAGNPGWKAFGYIQQFLPDPDVKYRWKFQGRTVDMNTVTSQNFAFMITGYAVCAYVQG